MPTYSILPASLETKRRALIKAHNLRVALLLLGLFALVLLAVAISPWAWSKVNRVLFGIGVAAFFGAEFYGLTRIFKGDVERCQQTRFLCPHCQAPLYESRSHLHVTGRCPKCRQSVIASDNPLD